MRPQFTSSQKSILFVLSRYTIGEELRQIQKSATPQRQMKVKYIVKQTDLATFLLFLTDNAGKTVSLIDENEVEHTGFIVSGDIEFKQIADKPCQIYETSFDFEGIPAPDSLSPYSLDGIVPLTLDQFFVLHT